MNEVLVTTLVENTVNVRGLHGEHGLCFLLRAGGRQLLFDTGQSALAAQNARAMGLDASRADAVVLSHGHYDHTGGLQVCWEQTNARLFLHPDAIAPKYTCSADGRFRYIGMSEASVAAVRAAVSVAQPRVVWTPRVTEVLEGIWVTGEIPRTNGLEDVGGSFYTDSAGANPDPLRDDQAIFFETRKGTVVLLGCAHAGVVNTLQYVEQLTEGRPIAAVLGGMHLLSASVERMRFTLAAFRRWSVGKLAPAHCTGFRAAAQLWHAFPDQWALCPVGSTFQFVR